MFGRFIKTKRMEQGLSQQDLADKAKINLKALVEYEADKSRNIVVIGRILYALGYELSIKTKGSRL